MSSGVDTSKAEVRAPAQLANLPFYAQVTSWERRYVRCRTELRAEVPYRLNKTPCVLQFCSDQEVAFMNNIVYIVGAVVIVLVILSFVGLV
ncbi:MULTISPECIES: hypothetical protein [Pseudomonas]|uniref:hypothetical protein n=1 Tax=Pseudomonas TaxID=286 RepID=UPI0008116861|nr:MULTISPECIES: hypothetical protein [Pseudomonas]ATR83756.1 hypothetical protein CS390_15005 [Pseudomonas sp. HLS-6]